MAKPSSDNLDRKFNKIQEGLQLLESWVLKLIEQGIDVLQKDETRIEDLSTRLVDAGIPSIARRLRIIPEKIKSGVDWQEFVLSELAEIYFFCQAAKKKDALNDSDIQQFIGLVKRKTDIQELNLAVQDQWLSIGKIQTKEENIVIIRNWFYGLNTKHFALNIDYMVNRFTKARDFKMGYTYAGVVYYYPSLFPSRVIQIPQAESRIPNTYQLISETISEFLDRYASIVSQVPWIKQVPCILHQVQLQIKDNGYFISNQDEGIKILVSEESAWRITLLLMDKDSKIFCEYGDGCLQILSIYNNGYVLEIN